MRVVFTSDTHHRYGELVVPDGDVFVSAGDVTMMGDVPQISKYGRWLERQMHKHKITVPGNHDWLFQRDEVKARSLVPGYVLIDQEVTIEGVKFYGSPWQPWFCDWAFNLRRGDPLRMKWSKIPTDTDVLITHGPPHGHLDLTRGYDDSPREHVGCKDLREYVEKIKPKYHVFGHIHCGYGMDRDGNTTFINASICNEHYEHANEPIVVDI